MALLTLVDGDLISFDETHDYDGGCETCDYGSSYVQDFSIVTNKGSLHLNVDEMYQYAISHDYLLKLILPNAVNFTTMTVEEFFTWFETEVTRHLNEKSYTDTDFTFTRS